MKKIITILIMLTLSICCLFSQSSFAKPQGIELPSIDLNTNEVIFNNNISKSNNSIPLLSNDNNLSGVRYDLFERDFKFLKTSYNSTTILTLDDFGEPFSDEFVTYGFSGLFNSEDDFLNLELLYDNDDLDAIQLKCIAEEYVSIQENQMYCVNDESKIELIDIIFADGIVKNIYYADFSYYDYCLSSAFYILGFEKLTESTNNSGNFILDGIDYAMLKVDNNKGILLFNDIFNYSSFSETYQDNKEDFLTARFNAYSNNSFPDTSDLTDSGNDYYNSVYNEYYSYSDDAFLSSYYTYIEVKFDVSDFSTEIIPSQFVKRADYLTLPQAPIKNGYNFKRWSCDDTNFTDFYDDMDDLYTNLSNENSLFLFYADNCEEIIFTPIYEKNSYTITFNIEGVVDSTTKEYDEYLPEPTEPTKEGYIFKGWSTVQNGTNFWDFSSNTVKSEMTLYAVFENPEELEDTNIENPEDTKIEWLDNIFAGFGVDGLGVGVQLITFGIVVIAIINIIKR